MARTLDSGEEARMLEAIKRAGDLVDNHDMSPDDAVEKVAREYKLGPGEIQAICYGHNTGRQLAQMRSGGSILDKFAEFPLADAAKVTAAIFPSATKQAAARDTAPPGDPRGWVEERSRRTSLVKLASAPCNLVDKPPEAAPAEPQTLMKRAYAKYERAKRTFEEARRACAAAEDGLRVKLASLAEYFNGTGRVKLAAVEEVARTRFGPDTKPLFDYVASRPYARREKRAGDTPSVIDAPVNWARAPFSTVAECVKQAGDVAALRAARDEAQNHYWKVAEENVRPFRSGLAATNGQSARRQPSSSAATTSSDRQREKAAFYNTPAFGAAMGNAIGKVVGDVPKTKSDMIEDEWIELEDPSHQNELRKIRAHAMLNSMLTDPDDPISSHDPDQVVAAFNEISQLAPRVSEQPAAMRPLLQRRLQGNVQPFETKEITDMEKGLAQTKNQTPGGSLLKDGPDSLLG